jgi:AraC-like DNA-binding protein
MTASGTATFTNPDDYRAGIGGASVRLVLTRRGDFKARLTWLKLRHLQVLRGRENLPRITYVTLPPGRAFVWFPVGPDARPIWNGMELKCGDILFHSRGERGHHRTKGASQWALMSLPPRQLAAYGKVLTGRKLIAPAVGRVLRPAPRAAAQLRGLLAKACRVAETHPDIIAHPEAARALEQELIRALVDCLAGDEVYGNLATIRHHAEITVRFEDALAASDGRQPSAPELSAMIGVPERTLRQCCAEVIGLSPSRYIRLRRLHMVRAALRRADPTTASVAEIAQRYQFSELGRFAVTYRTTFGETPSATLRSAAIKLT